MRAPRKHHRSPMGLPWDSHVVVVVVVVVVVIVVVVVFTQNRSSTLRHQQYTQCQS